MKVIYEIKICSDRGDVVNVMGSCKHFRQDFAERLREPIQEILDKGCHHIILGCTELPLIMSYLREVFPKRTNFDLISDDEIRRVQNVINNRPMKVLNWHSPSEVFSRIRSGSDFNVPYFDF